MSSDYFGTSAAYARKESDYREKALKLYPWVCGAALGSLFIQT